MKFSTLMLICVAAMITIGAAAGFQTVETSRQGKAPAGQANTPPQTSATHSASEPTKNSAPARNPALNPARRTPATQQSSAGSKRIEAVDCDVAIRTNSVAGYEGFLKKHPNSTYKPTITEKLSALREDDDWSRALHDNTIADFRRFHELHPESRHLRVEKATLLVRGVSGPGHPEVENIIDGMTLHEGRYYSQLRVTVQEYPAFSQELSPGDAESLGVGETVFENSNNYMWVRPSLPSREVTLYKIQGSVGARAGAPDPDDFQLAVWVEDLHRGVALEKQQ